MESEMESGCRVITYAMKSQRGTEADDIVGLWDRLGVEWTDEKENAEDLRREYSLPDKLFLGSVFAGPGQANYFFDAAGRYIGYGAIDLHEEPYFVERGRNTISSPRYNSDRDTEEISLTGRYSGMSTKTHNLKDLPEEGRERLIGFFSGLPSALGGLAYTGPANIEEWDILRITTESVLEGMPDEPPVDYLVTHAKPEAKSRCIRIDAYRIHRS